MSLHFTRCPECGWYLISVREYDEHYGAIGTVRRCGQCGYEEDVA